jgi:hypothetical protein
MRIYRLVSIYYSPEFTRYELHWRWPFGRWRKSYTIDARDLPEAEKRRLFPQ